MTHSDDLAVDQFAAAMKAKLARKRVEGYGGWETCDARHLGRELIKHLPKGDPVDVANFAMMLFHREGGYLALQQAVLEWPE